MPRSGIGHETPSPTQLPEEVNAYLDTFHTCGGGEVNTARGHPPHAPGSSEERLGLVATGGRFLIDTKVLSFTTSNHAK
jgi:aflatoxin B1 aldehyde reductase